MANKSPISQLPAGALAGASVDVDADYLPIDDVSAGNTKRITPKELLANSLAILPSGSGAVVDAVQAALRRMPHSAQYDTAANFNTAQAALTGTAGFKQIRVGTGTDDGVFLPSQLAGAYFQLGVGGTTFNGQFDPTAYIGYSDPDGSGMSFSFEGHYYDGATRWFENNFETTISGIGTTRHFSMQVNRATNVGASWQWAGATISFNDVLNGTPHLELTASSVAIGTVGVTGTRVTVGGTQNQDGDQIGINYVATLGALVGGNNAVGIRSAPSTVASAITVGSLYLYAANDGTKGSGSTITNQYGFACGDLVNGTNNYGFEGLVTSGANKWNLHMSGSAQNLLTGVTGIGIAASSTAALTLAAGTTGVASLRIPHGAAPSSPVNGDIWTDTSAIYVRINGTTKTVAFV